MTVSTALTAREGGSFFIWPLSRGDIAGRRRRTAAPSASPPPPVPIPRRTCQKAQLSRYSMGILNTSHLTAPKKRAIRPRPKALEQMYGKKAHIHQRCCQHPNSKELRGQLHGSGIGHKEMGKLHGKELIKCDAYHRNSKPQLEREGDGIVHALLVPPPHSCKPPGASCPGKCRFPRSAGTAPP